MSGWDGGSFDRLQYSSQVYDDVTTKPMRQIRDRRDKMSHVSQLGPECAGPEILLGAPLILLSWPAVDVCHR